MNIPSIHTIDTPRALYEVRLASDGSVSHISRSRRTVWNRHYRRPLGRKLSAIVRLAQAERAAQEG